MISHETCAPVANAMIDVWQSDDLGHYDNRGDSSSHHCRTVLHTDENGYYEYWTFKPPQYIVGLDVYRPSHIHLIVVSFSKNQNVKIDFAHLKSPNLNLKAVFLTVIDNAKPHTPCSFAPS